MINVVCFFCVSRIWSLKVTVELLLDSCKKLSFLDIRESEFPTSIDFTEQSPKDTNEITFSGQEQLKFYKTSGLNRIRAYLVSFGFFWKNLGTPIINRLKHVALFKYTLQVIDLIIQDYNKYRRPVPKSFLKTCIVPLTHFNSYSMYPLSNEHIHKRIKTNKISQESLFIQIAATIDNNSMLNEGDIIFEMILEDKWRQFARARFMVVYMFHVVFDVSYTVGISFGARAFSYSPGTPVTHAGQIVCICLMFSAGVILLVQELRQLTKSYSKSYYLLSLYNWIDLACLILPTVMFISLLQGKTYLVSIPTKK